ncbi:MAG: putative membrane protein [Gammaproteobacteria bacterium]|jgi:putative membrane protein
MIWVKALHIIFMVAWFAGIFYLPRLFVNHTMTTDASVKTHLGLMEKKLYRFMTPWMLLTIITGLWLTFDYAWVAYAGMLWLQIKIALVVLLVIYHFYCGRIIKQLEAGNDSRSHIWFRWFNELPVIILSLVVILVIVKPI